MSFVENGLGESHGFREPSADVPVAQTLTQGADDGSAALYAEIAVGRVQIVMLEGGRRGQDNVGVARRVRHEALGNDNEEIFALKPPDDGILIRVGTGRVCGPDKEGFDRNPALCVFPGKGSPETGHVQGAHGMRTVFRVPQKFQIVGVARGAGTQVTGPGPAPRADECGEQKGEPGGHGAVAVAGDAAAETDARGFG